VTAPLADEPRLRELVAWDASGVRRVAVALAGTADRLQGWRARLEAIGRSVESGECWSGPAASSAVGALLEVAAVGFAVRAAAEAAVAGYDRLAAEAALTADLAEQALASSTLVHEQGAAAGEEALRHAALAAAAAEDAGTAFARLGVRDAFAPADFGELLAHVAVIGPVQAPRVPSTRSPAAVSAWWAGLSPPQQQALISGSPALVGGMDGLPAWARDRANRALLHRALAVGAVPSETAGTAEVVARTIAAAEARGEQVQLQLLDLTGDRVVLAVGDLDTADMVALLVPGVGNSPGRSLGGLLREAEDLGRAARDASPGTTVATAVWLGYRPPASLLTGVARLAAWRGGPALADSLAGLAAARSATATGRPRTTVVAHSYGTVVVDEAADEPGLLAADAVVLLGSPGMEDDAAGLEAPAVFDAAGPSDPISGVGWLGHRTAAESFGSTGLPVTAGMGHSDYLDPGFPTLAAVGRVVAGREAG
jgi:hypothetical protein